MGGCPFMVVYRHVDIPDASGRIGLDDVILESGSCHGTDCRYRLPVPENIMPAHAGAGCPGCCRISGACPV